MTRRFSTRAQAQEIYRAMVEDEADRVARAKNAPIPNLSPQGGGEHAASGRGGQAATSGGETDPSSLRSGETDLTARAEADCKRAQAIAAEAEYEAKLEELARGYNEAWNLIGQALAEQEKHRAERDKLPAWRRPQGEDLVDSAYDLSIEMTLDWARAVREERAVVRAQFHELLDAKRAGPQDEGAA